MFKHRLAPFFYRVYSVSTTDSRLPMNYAPSSGKAVQEQSHKIYNMMFRFGVK